MLIIPSLPCSINRIKPLLPVGVPSTATITATTTTTVAEKLHLPAPGPRLRAAMGSKTTVEAGDFPIVCESCLGPNPYVRMLEDRAGRECKVCERPFVGHSWRPGGHGMRPKKTEICQTCARVKNVCQTCLLDLQYNLPVQVRDLALPSRDRQATVQPRSEATREYAAAQADRKIAAGEIAAVYAQPSAEGSIAEKARRTEPQYARNRARVCTFYAKGKCTRGVYCPYRHEVPTEADEAYESEHNLRDRYYGINDPVATKIIRKASEKAGRALDAPEDPNVRTLFIAGGVAMVGEDGLRGLFGEDAGIAHVNVLTARGIAFVDFATREDAENAFAKHNGTNKIGKETIIVKWGRSSTKRPAPVQQAVRESKSRRKEAQNV